LQKTDRAPYRPTELAGFSAITVKTRLAGLEAALGDNTWLDGNDFTVGDLMMISVLGGLRRTGELAAFPRLAAYVARGEGRPAHRKAMADHMATFDAPASA
jgi:glutathione S-transferase